MGDPGANPGDRHRRDHIWFIVRVGVSTGLILLVVNVFDVSGLGARLKALRPLPFALCVAALFGQIMLVSARWQAVLHGFDVGARWSRLLRYTLVGQFFSQLLPSTVGGDAIKGWLLYRDGSKLRRVVLSVIADRVIGMAALLLIVATVLQTPLSRQLDAAVTTPLMAVSVLGVGGVVCLWSLPAIVGVRVRRWRMLVLLELLARGLRSTLGDWIGAARVIVLSVAVHACSVVGAVCAARAVGLSLDLGVLVLVFPIALLTATIPISIGGWGVREGTLVGLLGSHGVPADAALALSVVFGVALAAASLPGAWLWYGYRRDVAVVTADIERELYTETDRVQGAD